MASPRKPASPRRQQAVAVIATFEAARELDAAHPGALESVLAQASAEDRALIEHYRAVRAAMQEAMLRVIRSV